MDADFPDLDLLRTFAAIHRAGSMTGAATLLGVSQPTVTARLRQLEKLCAARLFERQARGCVATVAGDELAARLHGPLSELESIAGSLAGQPDLSRAVIRLGAPAELTEHLLAHPLAGLAAAGITVHLTLGLAGPLLDGLATGTLDLVVSTVKPPARTTWQPLLDEEFVLVGAPHQWPATRTEALRKAPGRALHGIPRISYDAQQSIIRRWWRHVLGAPPPAAPRVTAPDLRCVRALVEHGAGISVLPRYLCAPAVEAGRLAALLEPEDAPINTVYLVTLPSLRTRQAIDVAWSSIVGGIAEHHARQLRDRANVLA